MRLHVEADHTILKTNLFRRILAKEKRRKLVGMQIKPNKEWIFQLSINVQNYKYYRYLCQIKWGRAGKKTQRFNAKKSQASKLWNRYL